MSQEVVLLRHGETEWSRDGRHTGTTEVPLTARGRHQASLAAGPLARWSFARVLVSPLGRARETARLAGLIDVEIRPDLAEWDYGDYDGRTTQEIREERPSWWLWDDGTPGGESVEEVATRADRVIREVRSVDGDVALVAHGHLLRVLAARWLGQPGRDGRLYLLSTATLSVLGYERDEPVIARWNDASHLD